MIDTITLMKGDAGTPARFWDYVEVLPEEIKELIKEGYIPYPKPQYGLRKSHLLKMKLIEINKRSTDV